MRFLKIKILFVISGGNLFFDLRILYGKFVSYAKVLLQNFSYLITAGKTIL